jgi:hypothetical protein
MYMGPITRAKPAVSPLVRRSVGAVALPVAGVVMLPFLAGYALYAGVALTARGLLAAPRALGEMVDYAGEVLVGR